MQKALNGTWKYFICNRSGTYASQSTGKRAMKSQGISKIGSNCTARIKLHLEETSTVVTATICNLHYGHDNELSHLRISKTDRAMIANQLASGIEHSRIQRNLFTICPTELQRQHLTTKVDLKNISKAYGIDKIEKHTEDYLSVDAYVEENLQQEKSIFLYKRQGENCLNYPLEENCPLEKEDFALGLMTDFQCEMLKKFGNEIVCLDATHGTNSYDFKLITVLVVDEYKEGIPVAWLLCNRETYTALKLFFILLKKQAGNIIPKIIMTDKAPQYFKSWNDVFEGMPQKLLCHWHVHHDWQKNLNKIKNKITASSLYKGLCLLLEEPEKEKFNNLLQKYMQDMYENEYTNEFAQYFKAEWLGIEEQWAKCYRYGSGINTNMYVESFHKSLKYGDSYFKGKQGRRMDKCLYVLLDFAKDLCIKRLIKLGKGKCTKRTTGIHKRHRASMQLSLSSIKQISPESWRVKSEQSLNPKTKSAVKIEYEVQRQEACTRNCQMKCQYCDICLHSYTCNCPDAFMKTTICKHIHLIVRSQNADNIAHTAVLDENGASNETSAIAELDEHRENNNSNSEIADNIAHTAVLDENGALNETSAIAELDEHRENSNSNYQIADSININEEEICQNANTNRDEISANETQSFDESFIFQQVTGNVNRSLADLKSGLHAKAMALDEMIENCNCKELLLIARKHINSATAILKLKNNDDASKMKLKNNSSRKNVIKQYRLHSTKQKKNRKNIRYSKPNNEERDALQGDSFNNFQAEEHLDHAYASKTK